MTPKELKRAKEVASLRPEPILTLPFFSQAHARGEVSDAEAIRLEYAACREVEKRYSKRIHGKWYFENAPEATKVCRDICVRMGVYGSAEVHHLPVGGSIGGHQSGRMLIIQTAFICVATVLHELAHYIIYKENLQGAHDRDFLWVLEMVYDCYLGETGK